jgi:hypothetical protein
MIVAMVQFARKVKKASLKSIGHEFHVSKYVLIIQKKTI